MRRLGSAGRMAMLGGCAALAMVATAPPARADTLDAVRARQALRCGVNESPGYAFPDQTSAPRGIEVDLCRATATAVFGDPSRAHTAPVGVAVRLDALKGGGLDVLFARTTWTMRRQVGSEARFVAVYLYDGQGFLVREDGPTTLAELAGRKLCAVRSSTSFENAQRVFDQRRIAVTWLPLNANESVDRSFLLGQCDAMTSDRSALIGVVRGQPPGRFRVLDEVISKEPLSIAVHEGSGRFATVAQWAFFALVAAEEAGLSGEAAAGGVAPAARAFAALSADAGTALGLAPDWALKVVAAGGNYGEIYDRHFGRAGTVPIPRGLNRLWRDGGLMYAPPF